MQGKYFTILFYIRRKPLLKTGEASIGLRITVKGVRAEMQIKRSVPPEIWNAQKECAVGNDKRSRELNHYIETIRTKILCIHRELEQDHKLITAKILLDRYCGRGGDTKMLLPYFEEHNKKCRELLGKDYVLGTVLRYERTVRYLSEYIQLEYKQPDIRFKDIDTLFIKGFEHYLKAKKGCAQNATTKYLTNLKKIVRIAFANHWIEIDPFHNYQLQMTRTNREFLLEEELNILIAKEFTVKRLKTVKDIFIFCCFTSLAFSDVKCLRAEHIMKDDNGEYWIRKPREKTDTMCSIPLLDIPIKLLEKYYLEPHFFSN